MTRTLTDATTQATCPHPPTAYYCWHGYNHVTGKNDWLIICCTDCGRCLKGHHEEYDAYLRHYIQEARP